MLISQCDGDDQHVGGDLLEHVHMDLLPEDISSWCLWTKICKFLMAPVLPFMWCYRHQRYCFFNPCDVDNSGFPRVDYSPAGSQLGCHGPTFIVLLALLAWRRCHRTKIVCLENVAEFPVSIVRSLMEDLYVVEEYYVTLEDAGCEYISRMRVFMLLCLKGQGFPIYVLSQSQTKLPIFCSHHHPTAELRSIESTARL